jgi:hypothetical protein
MKTFLVEMDNAGYGCEISNGVMCTHYNTKKHCKGDLNNRPAFCPLCEVKPVNYVNCRTFTKSYVEVKKCDTFADFDEVVKLIESIQRREE